MIVTDWDAVELDYRQGMMSVKEICLKHRVTESDLKNAAKTRGWTQTVLTPEDEADVMAYAEQETPRYPVDSLFSPEDVKKNALLTAGQVIRHHRNDVAKLRASSMKMLDSIDAYIATGDIQGSGILKYLGAKEGPSDLIEKISRTMTRYVALERQAYGMESMAIHNDEGEEDPMAAQIKALSESLRQITADKAQRPEPTQEVVATP